MAISQETLKAALTEAKRVLLPLPGVQGVGLGDDVIRVYILNADAREQLPAELLGVPVEPVTTGDIRMR